MITKAVKQGRIKPCMMIGKRAVFDFDECDEAWEKNKDPSNRGWEKPQRPQRVEVVEVIEAEPVKAVEEPTEVSNMTFNEARTLRERYQAQLARLEFEEKAGKLIDAEVVRREYFKQARTARDNLLNIPDRLAPMLLGRTELHEVRMLLLEEIHKVCESLAEE
jgi:hypothetical protein